MNTQNTQEGDDKDEKAPSTQGSIIPPTIVNKYRHLDSYNLTQIDELTDSQKNVYSAEQSWTHTPYMAGGSSHTFNTRNKQTESLKISNKVSKSTTGNENIVTSHQNSKIQHIDDDVNIFGDPHRVSDDASTPLDDIENNKQVDLDDIELLNEYEKKINNDIVELERKMQDFIRK